MLRRACAYTGKFYYIVILSLTQLMHKVLQLEVMSCFFTKEKFRINLDALPQLKVKLKKKPNPLTNSYGI